MTLTFDRFISAPGKTKEKLKDMDLKILHNYIKNVNDMNIQK